MGDLDTQLQQFSANSYNAAGQLVKTTSFSVVRSTTSLPSQATMDSWKTANASAANDRTTRFYYDGSGQLRYTIDGEGFVSQADVDAEGRVTKSTRWSNAITVGDSTTVDNVTSLLTAGGGVRVDTLTSYDALGRVDTLTNSEGYITRRIYGANGLVSDETIAWGISDAATTHYVYDAAGRATETHGAYGSPEVSIVKRSFDGLGNVLTVTDPNNKVTTFTYDRLGQVLSETDALSGVVSYQYDAFGAAVKVTDAYGGRTVSFYDDLGRKTDEVGPLGTMTHWTYDANGNVLTARVYGDAVAVPLATATTPPAPINASNYRETVYTYDSLNRLKTTSIANVLVGSWNGSNGVAPATVTISSSIDYDANGNVTRTTDANGNATYSYYDKLGRKTVQADAENYLTSWTYDAEGNVLAETRFATQYVGTPVAGGTPPTVAADAVNDRTTSFTYDKNGHRLTETRANVKIATVSTVNGAITETTVSSTVTYTYNGLGQVLTKQEASGDTVAYTYDLITQVHRGALLTENFTYDILGQRITHWNSFFGAGTVETTDYDLQGRIVSTKDFAGDITTNSYVWSGTVATALGTTGGWTQTTTQFGKTKSETSDIFGNTTSETDFGGHTKTNSYDKAGRLTNVTGSNGTYTTTLAHSYFNTGLLSQTVDTAGAGLNTITATFAYDAGGNRTAEKYVGTVYKSVSDASYASYVSSIQTLQDATIGYDELGRLISFTNLDGAGLVSLTLTQEYDLNSNIRKTNTVYPDLVTGGTRTNNQLFGYDSMNRMVNGQTTALTTSSNDVVQNYNLTYDLAGNRKTSTRKWDDAITIDDTGKTKIIHVSEIETYSYDAENRLTGVTITNSENGATASTTTRDALGRVTGYTESDTSGVTQNRYGIIYNARGQVALRSSDRHLCAPRRSSCWRQRPVSPAPKSNSMLHRAKPRIGTLDISRSKPGIVPRQTVTATSSSATMTGWKNAARTRSVTSCCRAS